MRPLGVEIVALLAARGVETVFGIPGVHTVELYRGMAAAGMAHVLARHEQGAGFMADGYARESGRPAAVFVISGPGVSNVLTPVGQAASDGVPMLVIASTLPIAQQGAVEGRLHALRDQAAMAGAVAEWSLTAGDAESALMLVERALMEFDTGARGPRVIHVPTDVLAAASVARPQRWDSAAPALLPNPGDVARVARMLGGADRPLFVFGGGAARGWEAARRILALTGAVSFTSAAGKGITDPTDPLAFGGHLSHPESFGVFAEADLVLAVGTRLAEVDLWRDRLGNSAPLVRIDRDPAVLAGRAPARLAIQADAPRFLESLAGQMSTPTQSRWSAETVAECRARWRADAGAARPGVLPAVDALGQALPADARVFSDMTQFAYVALAVLDRPRPGLWHHPSGYGTLGYALPAAIGAKCANRAAPILALIGDSGFQYTGQELATAVELGLNLPILLWDNGGLGEIERAMTEAQVPPNAVTARNPDFLALARAYGAIATEPKRLSDLASTLADAFAAPCPTLIRLTPDTPPT